MNPEPTPRERVRWYDSQAHWHLERWREERAVGFAIASPAMLWHFNQARWFGRRAVNLRKAITVFGQ